MDKIDFAKWDNYFGAAAHSLLHASDRYVESKFNFNEPGLPSGEITTVSAPGLTLTQMRLQTLRPFQLLDNHEKESAESLFVLRGEVSSSFAAYLAPLRFSDGNQSLQYNPNFSGKHTIYSKEFHAVTVTYDIPYLSSLLQSTNDGQLQQLAHSIQKKQTFLPTNYCQSVSGRIAEVIHHLQTCPFQGATRYVFIESKMLELFALQMEQLQATATSAQKWNKQDVEKLTAVKEFLERAYLDAFSLRELTYKFGLNEYKLKRGFRELFQTTVFGHVHHLRMQKAKALLQQDMPIADVAFFIGYENVSSFTTEFRKRFGHTPKKAILRN